VVVCKLIMISSINFIYVGYWFYVGYEVLKMLGYHFLKINLFLVL
jgi:hypothetical protein